MATPFFELIKNDEHKYIVITHSKELKNIIEPKAPNIKCFVYNNPTRFQVLIYNLFLNRVYETVSLRSKKSKDQKVFYDRMKNFNKKKHILGFISYYIYKIIGNNLFNKFEKFIYYDNFYKGFNADRILITNYHSIHEKMIFYTLRNKPVYFFTDGWDAFTKNTFYSQLPNKFLLWNEAMKDMLVKNCNINLNKCELSIVGNPFWDILPKTVHKDRKVLFFSNNSLIYNEQEILSRIYDNISKTISFSIRLPPTAEYENRYHKYLAYFPDFTINEIDIDFWLKYSLSKNYLFDRTYIQDLTSNSIFIFTGASTAMLDVKEMNGCVVMVCFDNLLTKKSLWDYRLSWDREVMNEMYNYDKFYRFNNVEDLLNFLNKFTTNNINKIKSRSNYSSLLYSKIEETH
ncbi:hypothetical protein N9832_05800 [Amylibacter sp.]|nr:hypothetical protein [Amylibacter sp.]